MDMENQNGEMVEYIEENGKWVNNMVMGLLFITIKLEKDIGKMVNQQNGVKVKYFNNNDIL